MTLPTEAIEVLVLSDSSNLRDDALSALMVMYDPFQCEAADALDVYACNQGKHAVWHTHWKQYGPDARGETGLYRSF